MAEQTTPHTTDRLRAEIDASKDGEVDHSAPPAAAPLGTDDEAAGTPNSDAQVAQAQAAESKAEAKAADRPAAGTQADTTASNRNIVIGVSVAVALVLTVIALLL